MQSKKIRNERGRLIENLIGNKYGRLTIIKFSHMVGTESIWISKCECGNEKVVSRGVLIQGNTKSCGCLHRESSIKNLKLGDKTLPYGVASSHTVYAGYKNSALKRQIEFNISYEEAMELFTKNCFYCGKAPSQVLMSGRGNGDFIYNGLDRIDSSGGYTLNNLVTCCKHCNYSKRDLPLDEFKSWVTRVYDKLIKGKNNV